MEQNDFIINLIPEPLQEILELDGFVIFIKGYKGSGKTNFAMLLTQLCHEYELRKLFATNIHSESYYISQIDNYPDLETWLHLKGKKLYVLDELGKTARKLRFMTEKNLKIMDTIQLIRHYDSGFVGIAPSQRRVDSGFYDEDVCDAIITKLSLQLAGVNDLYHNTHYFIHDVPKTSISHKSKDDALFFMEKKIATSDLPLCCQMARLYMTNVSMENIGKQYNKTAEQVKRELRDHLRHCDPHISQATVEVHTNIQNPQTS